MKPGSNARGPGGAGCVLRLDTDVTVDLKSHLRDCTSNEAEYTALALGLRELIQRGVKHVVIYGDSSLV